MFKSQRIERTFGALRPPDQPKNSSPEKHMAISIRLGRLDTINKKLNPFDQATMSDYAFRNSASGNSVVTPKQRWHKKTKGAWHTVKRIGRS